MYFGIGGARPRYGILGAVAATVAALVTGLPAANAHESGNDGHIPANTNYGFEVIGRDVLAGVADGLYTDVWSHNGYAYVGSFQDPACDRNGVFVVDIEAALANYPNTEGAMVAQIPSPPNTRVNDVKVHRVGDRDVLVATQEPCGAAIPGAANAGNTPLDRKGEWRGQGPASQLGQGGISLYDVTDPTKPHALRKNFLEFGGVHNTYMWDWEGKTYLIGTADTFDFFDTFFVDITKPQTPKLLTVTGALDWVPQGLNLDQLETGSSGGIFNHDVWVEIIDGVPTAVVSYWDAGFVTLDVTDPSNPVFLRDSTYPNPEPIVGEPYEGNAHAAVFGGNGDYLFAGDEDFSEATFAVAYGASQVFSAGQALFGPPSETLSGIVIPANSVGCSAAEVPQATGSGQVALIDRGACFFSQKAASAQAQGYEGYIIANNSGDGLINMSSGTADVITIPGVFVGQSSGDAMKANPGQQVNASSIFDGWGYLHIINNTDAPITVPSMGMANPATMTVDPGFHLGYYAPAEAVEEFLPDGTRIGTDFGDLTMHNIEADPRTQDIEPMFNEGPRMFISWYSLGMRAVEYRPGHFHANRNGEGSYSRNVHEVGRFIAEEGSNFWGVHVDENAAGDQIILASDRNTGLWIFSFSCVTRVEIDGNPQDVFYCDPTTDSTGGE